MLKRFRQFFSFFFGGVYAPPHTSSLVCSYRDFICNSLRLTQVKFWTLTLDMFYISLWDADSINKSFKLMLTDVISL